MQLPAGLFSQVHRFLDNCFQFLGVNIRVRMVVVRVVHVRDIPVRVCVVINLVRTPCFQDLTVLLPISLKHERSILHNLLREWQGGNLLSFRTVDSCVVGWTHGDFVRHNLDGDAVRRQVEAVHHPCADHADQHRVLLHRLHLTTHGYGR